ncbi:hypothetical protein TWF102_000965 [Orbilia oligospora]|uniref:Uncharacterized protein n=1 Tax=Orbilia oligospora TaxID=2813651 RepID=A0A7C8NTM7_ORBOL|nr:hypothetical protein TWF102_000965 [Orbilia oligospora]
MDWGNEMRPNQFTVTSVQLQLSQRHFLLHQRAFELENPTLTDNPYEEFWVTIGTKMLKLVFGTEGEAYPIALALGVLTQVAGMA